MVSPLHPSRIALQLVDVFFSSSSFAVGKRHLGAPEPGSETGRPESSSPLKLTTGRGIFCAPPRWGPATLFGRRGPREMKQERSGWLALAGTPFFFRSHQRKNQFPPGKVPP